MNYRRIGRWAAAGAGLAAAGAGLWWLKERSTERPSHDVLRADGDFEVRLYPVLRVAETEQIGARDRALGSGFGLLADWFLGNGIAMTVPVLSEEAGPSRWVTRLVLPRGLDAVPAAGEGMTVGELAGGRVAVLKVGGKVDDRVLAAKRTALLDRVAAEKLDAGRVRYAFYNSPFLPGALRHNEVWVEVDRDGDRG